jgi:DNA-binding response OmpR family regulator
MADASHILVVEDDLSVVRGLVGGLQRAGFKTSLAMTGDEGLRRILHEAFDLVLLDLMLPDKSGFEILEAVQSRSSIPIVVLTAFSELPARLRSFESGAVDFVPKPFFMEELVARIRARLPLLDSRPRHELSIGDVMVDLDARIARRGDVDLELTAHEFNVLAYLMQRPGRALTRPQLAEAALPEGGDRLERTVDSHVSRIRKKLGPEAGARLKTVWGIGYRCEEEP